MFNFKIYLPNFLENFACLLDILLAILRLSFPNFLKTSKIPRGFALDPNGAHSAPHPQLVCGKNLFALLTKFCFPSTILHRVPAATVLKIGLLCTNKLISCPQIIFFWLIERKLGSTADKNKNFDNGIRSSEMCNSFILFPVT